MVHTRTSCAKPEPQPWPSSGATGCVFTPLLSVSIPLKGSSCDEDAWKVVVGTLMQPPGCILCSDGQKKHPDNTSQALDSVVIIAGQMQPSIFARGGFRAHGQVSGKCTYDKYLFTIY